MGFLGDLSLTLAKWKSKVRLDRPASWRFEVEIDGIRDKGFQECTGLGRVLQTEAIVECNSMEQTLIPVSRQAESVTLKKAVSFNSKLEEWFLAQESYKRGDPDPRRTVVIRQLYNVPEGVPLIGGSTVELKSWIVPKTYIIQLTGPDFNAMSKDGLSVQKVIIKSTEVTEVADLGGIASLMSLIQNFSG